jgi:hypothetical protein
LLHIERRRGGVGRFGEGLLLLMLRCVWLLEGRSVGGDTQIF